MSLVSVVIPVYNRGQLLQRALQSLQKQTLREFEIVVVDDHSTEDIRESIKDFPVRYLKAKGKGVSAARNTGIHGTQSPFVAFLDSDDEWAPSKLEKQMEYFSLNPSCAILHTGETWIREGQIVKQHLKHQKFGGRVFSESTKICFIAPSSVLARRSLFDRVGVFDESFPVCEDFDLWLRIASVEEFGFLRDPLTIKHGGHNDQLSMQFHSMDLWRVRALAKHLKNQNLTAEEKQALENSLKQKCEILLKGFEKHQNFENLEEVLRIKSDLETYSREAFSSI